MEGKKEATALAVNRACGSQIGLKPKPRAMSSIAI
jgi:hypothetical protein